MDRLFAVLLVSLWVPSSVGFAQPALPDEPGIAVPDEPGMAPPAATPPPTSAPSQPSIVDDDIEVVDPWANKPSPKLRALMDQWYYAAGKTRAGPFSSLQLQIMVRTGALAPATLVWRPGFPDWQPLHSVSELAVRLPPKDSDKRHPIKGLIIGGAITFGVTWSLALAASIGFAAQDECSDCDDVAALLWIPVLGPLLTNTMVDSDELLALTIIWSAAQAAGTTMLIIGAVGRKPAQPARTSGLHLTPLLGRTNGMGLTYTW